MCPPAAAVGEAGRCPEGDVVFGRKAEAMAAAEAEWEPAGLLPASGGGLDWGERGGRGAGRWGLPAGAGPALRPLSLPQRRCWARS